MSFMPQKTFSENEIQSNYVRVKHFLHTRKLRVTMTWGTMPGAPFICEKGRVANDPSRQVGIAKL